MIFTVSSMKRDGSDSYDEDFATLQEAEEEFNRRYRNADEMDVDWIAISIGAWGFMIEWNAGDGITLFRECDEDVVNESLEYINDNA